MWGCLKYFWTSLNYLFIQIKVTKIYSLDLNTDLPLVSIGLKYVLGTAKRSDGWVQKIDIFADFQFCVYIVVGWNKKN